MYIKKTTISITYYNFEVIYEKKKCMYKTCIFSIQFRRTNGLIWAYDMYDLRANQYN